MRRCLFSLIYRVNIIMWQLSTWSSRLPGWAKTRRALFVAMCIALIILYSLPSWLHPVRQPVVSDSLRRCIDDKLLKFSAEIDDQSAFVLPNSLFPSMIAHLPFVGNGKLGLAVGGQRPLYIRDLHVARSLALPVDYHPAVEVSPIGLTSSDALLTDIQTGVVKHIQCAQDRLHHCADVVSTFYAHRVRPSLLVQEISISNPTTELISLRLRSRGNKDWVGASSVPLSQKLRDADEAQRKGAAATSELVLPDVAATVGRVEPVNGPSVLVAIVTLVALDGRWTTLDSLGLVKVDSNQQLSAFVLTAVDYTVLDNAAANASNVLLDRLVQALLSPLHMNYGDLRLEHTTAWQQLWTSGFSVSYSLAPDSLNGDRINLTLYYVLSSSPAPLLDNNITHNLPTAQLAALRHELNNPLRCFGSHSLLYAPLWPAVESETNVADLTFRWLVTLEKRGCDAFVRAGADGLLQAILLSLGPFLFGNNHLELLADPKDLHRDRMHFRRLNYGDATHLNVSIVVNEDNRAQLLVALDRNDRLYYACDAGCLDVPVKLSKEPSLFPVKLTRPLTALLYITSNRQHMEELKHAIHLKHIGEAPAHENHVLSLHRYGHMFGVLPTLVWGSIALLVVVFHLFLFKLIYNEYCNEHQTSRTLQSQTGTTSGRRSLYSSSSSTSSARGKYGV